jgi:hypothetical protein
MLTILNKILNDDEITNKILKQINIIIILYLHRIYNVYLEKNYYLEHFRNTIIIVLRKLSKSNYFTITSYCSIVFLNILNKIFKFILIKKVNYLTKTHKLLLRIYIKIRQFISTKYALHYLVKRIYIT